VAGRAGRGALCRDPPGDARLRRFRDAAAERRPLLREAAASLLGQRRVAPTLRRDAVGGAPPDAPLRSGDRPCPSRRDGGSLGIDRRPRGRDPVSRVARRLRILARRPDGRAADFLLHGDSFSRARDGPAARSPPAVGVSLDADRPRRGGRIPEQGSRRRRPSRRDPRPLVFLDAARAPPLFAPFRTSAPRLPARRRALVRPGRAPHSRLSPILLHPRALPAVRDAGRAALGPDLLLHPRLFRRLPPRAPLLLRDIEAHARLAALERRGSGRVLLPALVRRRVPLFLLFAQQAAALSPPRVPRGRGPRRARSLSPPSATSTSRRSRSLASACS